ncbi:hypothetical protein FA13DRAFT_1723500 [Coprinellus micaceus]|uniref:Uncharacterized protein n=1 Tax=Coprinellus micaceus TaxID=71717 RepID=A0A4Y7R5H3_COPMI|nr:hypothetical protein FA13DRAFT_1723500 [Coprinellus micaceus]
MTAQFTVTKLSFQCTLLSSTPSPAQLPAKLAGSKPSSWGQLSVVDCHEVLKSVVTGSDEYDPLVEEDDDDSEDAEMEDVEPEDEEPDTTLEVKKKGKKVKTTMKKGNAIREHIGAHQSQINLMVSDEEFNNSTGSL